MQHSIRWESLGVAEVTGDLTEVYCSVRLATMKTATADRQSKADSKYAALVEDGLRELKIILQELRRGRASTERLRVESGRIMKETWAILHRVEATL